MTEPMTGPVTGPMTRVVAPPGLRSAPLATSRQRRRPWLGMVVISLGVSLIVVDATIVRVLLPRIVDELGLRATDAE